MKTAKNQTPPALHWESTFSSPLSFELPILPALWWMLARVFSRSTLAGAGRIPADFYFWTDKHLQEKKKKSKNQVLFLDCPNAEGIPTLSDCCLASLSLSLCQEWRRIWARSGAAILASLHFGPPRWLRLFNVVVLESRAARARRACRRLELLRPLCEKSLSNFSPDVGSAGGFRLLCFGFASFHI